MAPLIKSAWRRKIVLVLKQFLRVISRCGALPLVVVVSVARLAAKCPVLRNAQVAVVMPEGGFGHTVVGPDVARRLYCGKRCIFVVLSEYKRHNWKVASIWPDVHVIFLPLSLGIEVVGRSWRFQCFEWYKRNAPEVVLRFIRAIAGQRVLVLTLEELYDRMPMPATAESSFSITLPRQFRWPIAYAKLIQDVPAPSVRLPTRWRTRVRRRLDMLAAPADGVTPRRLCCLYLRQKGAQSLDIAAMRRSGSPIEDYLEGIRMLNKMGYQVLLIGDVTVEPTIVHQFHGMLVDAQSASVDKRVFSLYSATEADIFVGEVGGGTWLSGINGIPRLVLNAYPYFYGFPHSWMYYKIVTNSAGQLVHYRELFSYHAYDYDPPSMTIHNNSSTEILEAVSRFLEDIEGPSRANLESHGQLCVPEDTWIKHAKAKLSPAFLRLFEQ